MAASGWSQETANALKSSGCSVILLNSPDGLNVGIDYCMWKTGPKFMGIKLIPPGPHFIYWSLDDGEGKIVDGFRSGTFVYLELGQVRVAIA